MTTVLSVIILYFPSCALIILLKRISTISCKEDILMLKSQPMQERHYLFHTTPQYLWCFLLIAMSVCVLVAQFFPTLHNPVDCSLPGSSVHAILQAGILEWVAMLSPFSRGSSWHRDWTWVSCIAGSFFTTVSPGKHWYSFF